MTLSLSPSFPHLDICPPRILGGSVAEWSACWTQAQEVPGSIATLTGNSLGQTVHTHCASVHQAAKLVAALLRVAWVTAGLAESNGSLYAGFMTHVICRLTAKNRDQLRNPTLGNRVWATFLTPDISPHPTKGFYKLFVSWSVCTFHAQWPVKQPVSDACHEKISCHVCVEQTDAMMQLGSSLNLRH